jgi:hypothetical protein
MYFNTSGIRYDRIQSNFRMAGLFDDYFVSVRRDVVLIFALTPDHEVPLVRQYKHGAQKNPP